MDANPLVDELGKASANTTAPAGKSTEAGKNPAAPTQTTSLVTPGAVAVRGKDLSILVESIDRGGGILEFKVSLKGSVWEGRTIRGAIRAIEREYRAIKHTTMRAAVQAAADERRKAAISVVAK